MVALLDPVRVKLRAAKLNETATRLTWHKFPLPRKKRPQDVRQILQIAVEVKLTAIACMDAATSTAALGGHQDNNAFEVWRTCHDVAFPPRKSPNAVLRAVPCDPCGTSIANAMDTARRAVALWAES